MKHMIPCCPGKCELDVVWIPAVPLPFMGWRTDRCACGMRFRGRRHRARYELHWRLVHEGEVDRSGGAVVGVTRAEARSIYAQAALEGLR